MLPLLSSSVLYFAFNLFPIVNRVSHMRIKSRISRPFFWLRCSDNPCSHFLFFPAAQTSTQLMISSSHVGSLSLFPSLTSSRSRCPSRFSCRSHSRFRSQPRSCFRSLSFNSSQNVSHPLTPPFAPHCSIPPEEL